MSDPNVPPVPPVPPVTPTVPVNKDHKDPDEPSFYSENKKLIFIGIIIALMLLFIFQNLQDVKFTLFFVDLYVPLVVLILMFFAMGLITVWIYSYYKKRELRRKIRSLETRLKKYETL